MSVPYALVIQQQDIDSAYKDSLYRIQMSQKLPHTKSLDIDINTLSYLLLLTLVF